MPMQRNFALPGSLHQSILEDFLGSQAISSMNKMYFGAEVAEVQGLLHRCIATPHNGDFLVPIKETIASCASADAFAHKGRFGR